MRCHALMLMTDCQNGYLSVHLSNDVKCNGGMFAWHQQSGHFFESFECWTTAKKCVITMYSCIASPCYRSSQPESHSSLTYRMQIYFFEFLNACFIFFSSFSSSSFVTLKCIWWFLLQQHHNKTFLTSDTNLSMSRWPLNNNRSCAFSILLPFYRRPEHVFLFFWHSRAH